MRKDPQSPHPKRYRSPGWFSYSPPMGGSDMIRQHPVHLPYACSEQPGGAPWKVSLEWLLQSCSYGVHGSHRKKKMRAKKTEDFTLPDEKKIS